MTSCGNGVALNTVSSQSPQSRNKEQSEHIVNQKKHYSLTQGMVKLLDPLTL